MSVIVYSTESCPWCHKTKDFLKEHNIAFTDHNVGEDMTKAEEMVQKSGQTAVPVIDIDGEIIVGFNPERFSELLHLA